MNPHPTQYLCLAFSPALRCPSPSSQGRIFTIIPFPSPHSLLTSKLQVRKQFGQTIKREGMGRQAPWSKLSLLPSSLVPYPEHSSLKLLLFVGPPYSPAAWPRPGQGGTGGRTQPIICTGRTPGCQGQSQHVSEQSTSKEPLSSGLRGIPGFWS